MPCAPGCRTLVALLAVTLPRHLEGAERTLRVPEDHPTIQAAIDAARNGDTILVAPGTYQEDLRVDGKDIALTSCYQQTSNTADIERTILDGGKDGAKSGPPIITIAERPGSSLRLIGFTIRGSHHAVVNSGHIDVRHNHFRDNGDALSFESGKGTVSDNRFEHNRDDGIDMDGPSKATIVDNVLCDNRDDGIEIRLHPFKGPVLNIVIRGNRFERNGEDGLQLIDYPGRSDRTFRIEQNIFAGNRMAGLGCMEDGNTKENYQGAELPEPVVVLNNTFVGNLYGMTGGGNMVILNNVIADTTKAALRRIGGDSAAGVNLLWNNGADMEECDLSGDALLAKDPLLDENFRPKPGSPCLRAGATSFRYNGEELRVPSAIKSGLAPHLGAIQDK